MNIKALYRNIRTKGKNCKDIYKLHVFILIIFKDTVSVAEVI